MRKTKIMIGIGVAALLLGALAIGFTAPGADDGQVQCGPHGETWEQFLQGNDGDGNGTLSQSEFPGPEHAFTRVDADGDGQITREEAVEAAKTRHQRRGMQGRRAEQIDPQARWERLLDHADADGNGTISQEEFPGPEHAFERLDANDDGQITEAEGMATPMRRGGGPDRADRDPEARWQRMLEHLDADESGTISQEEFPGHDEVFAEVDADGDGQITQEEAAAMRRRPMAGGGPGQAHMHPEALWESLIERHDADESGTISRDEFMGPDHAFDRIDANDDGQITREEASEMAAQRRGMRGGGQGHGPRGTQQ